MDTAESIYTTEREGADRNRAIRDALVDWYRANARDLPWRRTRDPYAVLVSEFMAQQTQVATVVAYFERWMKRFPTVQALAASDESEVLAHWQGLGYYSRARNLHKAARAIADQYHGIIPNDYDALVALPGIGTYTAAAVAAFAFDSPAAVVDANVARVLARLFDFRETIESAKAKRFLQDAAISLQPADGGAGEFNSAIMELGALVCKPRTPSCPACPIRGECQAPDPESLPVKKARPKTTHVTERRAWILSNGCIHLAPATERWKGMWILPEIESHDPLIHIEIYPITRFRVRMEVVPASPDQMPETRAFDLAKIESVPIPSPHRRVIRALAGAQASMHPEV